MSRFFEIAADIYRNTERNDRYRKVTTSVGTPLGPRIAVHGHHDMLSFNTLQYLGDFGTPKIMQSYLDQLGSGLACSPLLLQADVLRECADTIADFKGFHEGSCLMFNSGYLAAKSAIELMISPNLTVAGDDVFRRRPPIVVFIDAYTHVSIQRPLMPFRKNDGNNQKVRTVVYRHLDYEDLEAKLSKYAAAEADKLIVTDTVFSMHGDAVDMRILYDLARRYGAEVLLDTAHSDGVYGREGRGFLFLEGLEDIDRSIFMEVGTLSKVFACGLGGYIVLPQPEIAHFAKKALESYIFAAGLPPYIAATARDVVHLIRSPHGERMRQHLHNLSARTREELRHADFDILDCSTHIIPVHVGDELCDKMHHYLLEEGISVGKVYWPAITQDHAILRVILTALHTEDHVEQLLHALKKVRDKVHCSVV